MGSAKTGWGGGEEGGSEINGTIAVEFIFSKSKARLLNKVKNETRN